MRPPEQECSGHAEGEPDLKRMCQPGENCKNQVGSLLLLQKERLESKIIPIFRAEETGCIVVFEEIVSVGL